MKKKAILLGVALVSAVCSRAQLNSIPVPSHPVYSSSIGLLVGTAGIGLDYYQPVGKQLGLQVGFNLMPFQTQIVGDYGQHATRSRAEAQMHNIHALLGWTPFNRTAGFARHITVHAGVAYFLRSDGRIRTTLNEAYFFGEIQVPADRIGVVTTDIDWKTTVSPYVGLALTDVRIDERFGFNASLGAYLLSSPEVRLTGTQLLAHNEANAPIIERNLKNYRYLPQIQLGVHYRLRLQ